MFDIPIRALRAEWRWLYLALGLMSLGAGAVLYAVLDALIALLEGHPLRALGIILAAIVVGIVAVLTGILLTRLWAFGFWQNRPGRQR